MRAVTSGAEKLAAATEHRKAERRDNAVKEIIADYDLAISFHLNNNGGTEKMIREQSGLSEQMYATSKKLVKLFGRDRNVFLEKLNEWLLTNPEHIYTRFLLLYYSPTKTGLAKRGGNKAEIKGTALNKLLHMANSGDHGAVSAVGIARKLLLQGTALRKELSDKDYLAFSPCCCCGDLNELPPEGWKLLKRVAKNKVEVKYPVCHKCLANSSQVDWELVSVMYVNYAKNLEYVFDAITEN